MPLAKPPHARGAGRGRLWQGRGSLHCCHRLDRRTPWSTPPSGRLFTAGHPHRKCTSRPWGRGRHKAEDVYQMRRVRRSCAGRERRPPQRNAAVFSLKAHETTAADVLRELCGISNMRLPRKNFSLPNYRRVACRQRAPAFCVGPLSRCALSPREPRF